MKRNTKVKKLLWVIVALFFFMNLVAFFHAYRFTHFSNDPGRKTESPEKLSVASKIKTLLSGVKNPRPRNTGMPSVPYSTVVLKGKMEIECWHIPAVGSKGTVAVFHGYSGEKSGLLPQASAFHDMGYNVLLVDFMGSGGSEGSRTTLGFMEAEQVKLVFDYLKSRGENSVFLFGTSMGAVAILKSIADYHFQPAGIIVECPFGSMYKTTAARFRIMKVPVFPMAGLLVFWGGIQNGFWAFGHNPTVYAKAVNCPALLMYGEQDRNVSRDEIDEIFANFSGNKTLKLYPYAGHENYLIKYSSQWRQDVYSFMGGILATGK